MWWWWGGLAGWAAAAGALALLLCRRRHDHKLTLLHQVHIVRVEPGGGARVRAPYAPVYVPPRATSAHHGGSPPPPATPPPPPALRPLPRLPLPFACRYSSPRLSPPEPASSVTRSPSLERDDTMSESSPPPPPPPPAATSPGNMRRYRSVSTRLDACTAPPAPPRAASPFDFSPKFFTPPETVSPMFFADPSPRSPRSVYYDTVRSPKFFAEAADVPQSPRALADHINRNAAERASSPRVLAAAGGRSPRLYAHDKENRFTFEVAGGEEGGGRRSPRPRRYLGRNSIERERFTPPADRERRRYRRHHSCDTDHKEPESTPPPAENADVVDCCANVDSQVETTGRERLAAGSVQQRRQRLKSISLDSDNARIIEQNLGLPIAKQLKDQMNEAFRSQEVSSPVATPPDPPAEQVDRRGGLRRGSDAHSFADMPRFSPKEFEMTVTSEDGHPTAPRPDRGRRNLNNLTIDLTRRDSDLERELLEFEQLYSDAEERKPRTPTLKVKATSLDSSEGVSLSLPRGGALEVPHHSVSVPNTPKRQLRRLLQQKGGGARLALDPGAEQRRLHLKGQDSGIFLRDNHAQLMVYQPADDPLAYKQTLSVSSTNLKTLPEGVPSDDFEPPAGEDQFGRKLHRRNSNQSLMLTQEGRHGLQGAASCHDLAAVRASLSACTLTADTRQTRLSLERRDSEQLAPDPAPARTCLLQRRGSNNSLTLNISRHSSNASLNKPQRKGLLERRSSNTSLTLNINTSTPQLCVTRALSVSNYNLDASACSLSRCGSTQSIEPPPPPPDRRRGILERRSSNTSLTLNITAPPTQPRDIHIDEHLIDPAHRKSLSTENLLPKSYRTRPRPTTDKQGFGSHDDLWSSGYTRHHNLTYVCGDEDNEIIYAFGGQDEPRHITTKPLSPQTTSEDFRLYLANMQHLQNASSVLTRHRLRDLDEVFQNGYSKVRCGQEGQRCCSGRVKEVNPQMELPEDTQQPCSEYQKALLRSLHQEFWDMPTNFQEKPLVTGSHSKNRYKTILPNEHSRVILRAEEGATAEGYINANYIKGHEYSRNSYVATQGPLQNTIYDFWLMVHQNCTGVTSSETASTQQVIQKIVMLTNFVENSRHKCEKYFPLEVGELLTAGSDSALSPRHTFTVRNTGLVKKDGYTIRKLEVTYSGDTNTITCYHYWFHNWADHKCPKDVNALLNLSLDVLNDTSYEFTASSDAVFEQCACVDAQPRSSFVFPSGEEGVACGGQAGAGGELLGEGTIRPPTIVHCSAGIGRTGCLIAVLNGMRQLAAEQRVDVLGIVCNMRLDRGGMVQSSEQYELVHKVLCLFERACLPPPPAPPPPPPAPL